MDIYNLFCSTQKNRPKAPRILFIPPAPKEYLVNTLASLSKELKALASPSKAKVLQGFFKTGKGEYGEGDVFLGITVPQTRRVAASYADKAGFEDIEVLLNSKVHEERLCALLILVHKFGMGGNVEKKEIYNFYLAHAKRANNWDLVDLSADKIVGEYLLEHPAEKKILAKFALSDNLWKRRISIIATFAFIRKGKFGDTFRIAGMLLHDEHDLIHKAVGWMLREIGKREEEAEEKFLRKHCHEMPRTMLRYAIERFGGEKRKRYLQKLWKR